MHSEERAAGEGHVWRDGVPERGFRLRCGAHCRARPDQQERKRRIKMID